MMAGLTRASIRPARALVDECRGVIVDREGRELQNAGVKGDSQGRPGAPQRPCTALRFDERNRLGLGHRLAPVLAVRADQCRGQLEPDNLAANNGRRMHDATVREGSH